MKRINLAPHVIIALGTIITFLASAPPSAAQAARVGPTFAISTQNGSQRADVAFDPVANIYVGVWLNPNGPWQGVVARAVAVDGTLLGTSMFKVPQTTAFSHSPRIAYSPAGFLVTWHDTRQFTSASVIWGRIMKVLASGSPQFITGDFQIQATGNSEPRSSGAVAYSTTNNEFLVTWAQGNGLNDIRARRVGLNGGTWGALGGGDIQVTSDGAWQTTPAVDYHPGVNQFLVAYIDNGTVKARRIQSGTGTMSGATVIDPGGGGIGLFLPDVEFDPASDRWLVAWNRARTNVVARWVNGDGTANPTTFPIMSGPNTMDAVSFARNAASGNFFFIFHGNSFEDAGVELANGNPGPLFNVTSTGNTVGNFAPRVAGAFIDPEWMIVTSTGYAVTNAQRVRTGGGGGGTPTLSIDDVSAAEGDSGTKQFTFTVRLSAQSSQTVTVDYATANGTTNPASAGSDYTAKSGVVTFPAQTQSQTINITVAGDTTTEPDEIFFVNLSGASNATIADNQGKGTILNDDFPPPMVLGVTPASGPVTGNTSVTITGDNFAPGASVMFGTSAASNVVRVNPTTITAKTPSNGGGPVMVEVINPDNQKGSKANAFTYMTVAGSPTVTGVTPNSGPTGGGTFVTITGTNFAAGATAKMWDVPLSNVQVVNSTTLTGFTGKRLAAGSLTVVVTNPNGNTGQLTGGFTYYIGPAVSLKVTSVTPNSGPTGGGTNVTIGGTSFVSPATVTFGGTPATNVVVVNGSTITATTPPHAAGAVAVAVTSGGNTASLASGFTYGNVPTGTGPTVTSVSPNSGPTTGGTAVTVTGANFQNGATVKLWDTPLQNVVVVNSTTITGTTRPRFAAGPVTVIVTNPDGQSGSKAGAFTYVLNP